jgi:hypothetical protein
MKSWDCLFGMGCAFFIFTLLLLLTCLVKRAVSSYGLGGGCIIFFATVPNTPFLQRLIVAYYSSPFLGIYQRFTLGCRYFDGGFLYA